jgi:hypothetical protein
MERGGAEHAASRASVGGTRFAPALSAFGTKIFWKKDFSCESSFHANTPHFLVAPR